MATTLILAMAQAHAATDALSDHCIYPAGELASRFLKAHRLDGENVSGEPSIATCVKWPGKESWHLAVLIYDTQVRYEKHMLIALVDLPKGRMVATYWTKVDADATTPYHSGSVSIDIAPYQLRPGVRAFGVEVATRFSAIQESGSGPERTLFVREGSQIRPVLQSMPMSRWEYIDGYRPYLSTEESPRPATEDFTYTIGIAPTTHNGYADLRITRRSSIASHPPVVEVLHYDGREYPRPRN